MKIHVVGGGPAGLYFSILMKAQDSRHDIRVFERNRPDATFGWGVVFSRRTLQILEDADPISAERASAASAHWGDVVIVRPGEEHRIGGNQFVGVERLRLLNVLQERARELGVELCFEHDVEDLDRVRDCDLLVGADGVNSRVRDRFASTFEPKVEPRHNSYIWLGTEQTFDGLTLSFRPSAHGLFMAHSYRYCPDTSTFIVECSQQTFANTGLAEDDEAGTAALLEEVFAEDLGGHPLLSNHSRWIQFLLVHTRRWHHENVVLVGDACHTVHFSIGSGTKQAMEDVIALAAACQDEPEVSNALSAYEARRKPVVDELQRAAEASLHWFETADSRMHLAPMDFAMQCMTRSEKLDLDRLRRRDPAFVQRWERAQG